MEKFLICSIKNKFKSIFKQILIFINYICILSFVQFPAELDNVIPTNCFDNLLSTRIAVGMNGIMKCSRTVWLSTRWKVRFTHNWGYQKTTVSSKQTYLQAEIIWLLRSHVANQTISIYSAGQYMVYLGHVKVRPVFI